MLHCSCDLTRYACDLHSSQAQRPQLALDRTYESSAQHHFTWRIALLLHLSSSTHNQDVETHLEDRTNEKASQKLDVSGAVVYVVTTRWRCIAAVTSWTHKVNWFPCSSSTGWKRTGWEFFSPQGICKKSLLRGRQRDSSLILFLWPPPQTRRQSSSVSACCCLQGSTCAPHQH